MPPVQTPSAQPEPSLSPALRRLLEARHHDPFAVLGRHAEHGQETLRVLAPGAEAVWVAEDGPALQRIPGTDLFVWSGAPGTLPEPYRLRRREACGAEHEWHDPYAFGPQLGDLDLHLFGEGRHWHAYRMLGAHPMQVGGVAGVRFATWAPNAERVSVVGDFNDWDGRRHPMRARSGSGVWELFIPGLGPGTLYKLEVRSAAQGAIQLKTDPYGQQFELRPSTASVVRAEGQYPWDDAQWLSQRRRNEWQHQPMSVYEAHLGSWGRGEDGRLLSYVELADRLVPYVKSLGFTHIELLPVTEHPLDESWGYQTTGYFAPTSRHGAPQDFRLFVDRCHRNGLGVILDWAPAHFPRDAHALARFDGTALYEHEDPRLGEHRDWGTLIFNYGRSEVKSFLLSSAMYWLEEMHVDGLRVDAVASMLYLNYSRNANDWIPNKYGGNENLEAIAFLRELNEATQSRHPGTVLIAEESTAWPQVTRPPWLGGLGFSMKWNMGWMHDTLEYMSKDPVFRHYHHDMLTFGLMYAFTENFVLPLSHDEVVHLKRSLLGKMHGDRWQRFANLRLLYTYMWTYPGKKLLFMGGEIAQEREWSHARALDWHLLDDPAHNGIQCLLRDLNRLYQDSPALYHAEFEGAGFEWIDCHDAPQSVISFVRRVGADLLVIALNFTPIPRRDYRIGVPRPGAYHEVLNSDSEYYGGSNMGNALHLQAREEPWMGRPYSLNVVLPPLAGVVFRPAGAA